jgi:tetratricopeptide (TPR) repeat protein
MRAKAQVAMQEARDYLTQSLELLPPDGLENRWRVLIERDEILGILGDIEGRKSDDQALIDMAQDMDDDNKLAHAYYRLGFFYNSQGQYKKELDAYEKALSAAQRAGDRNMETQILGLKVACLTRLGEMHEAGETADLALNRAFQLKHDDTFARTLVNVSIYYENGDIFKAVNLLNQATEVLGQLNDRNLEAGCLMNIGYLYILSGFPESGIPKLERSMEIAELLGNHRLIAYNKLNLGLANIRLGNYIEAQDILNETAAQLSDINDQFANGACQSYLGLALEGSDQCELAEGHFNNAWEMFNQIEAQGYAMDALAGQTRCFLDGGQLDQASKKSDRIWDFLIQNSPQGMEFPVRAYLTCAEVYKKTGDEQRRRKCIEEGYQQLMIRAEKISDPNWMQNYIQEVPEHFKIFEMSKKAED